MLVPPTPSIHPLPPERVEACGLRSDRIGPYRNHHPPTTRIGTNERAGRDVCEAVGCTVAQAAVAVAGAMYCCSAFPPPPPCARVFASRRRSFGKPIPERGWLGGCLRLRFPPVAVAASPPHHHHPSPPPIATAVATTTTTTTTTITITITITIVTSRRDDHTDRWHAPHVLPPPTANRGRPTAKSDHSIRSCTPTQPQPPQKKPIHLSHTYMSYITPHGSDGDGGGDDGSGSAYIHSSASRARSRSAMSALDTCYPDFSYIYLQRLRRSDVTAAPTMDVLDRPHVAFGGGGGPHSPTLCMYVRRVWGEIHIIYFILFYFIFFRLGGKKKTKKKTVGCVCPSERRALQCDPWVACGRVVEW